jgi:hypothetical protein
MVRLGGSAMVSVSVEPDGESLAYWMFPCLCEAVIQFG